MEINKIKLIYNPAAGDKTFVKYLDSFIEKFQKAGYRISIFRSMEPGDFAAGFKDIDESYQAVVVAGGDGTASNVLNIMQKKGIDLPMGIILGLFIGLLNMVPYLQTIGLIPAYLFSILSALQTGSSFWVAILLVTVVFVIIQTFQDGYLVPKIMGKVTGFSPAIILLSLSIWGKLLGFLGLIIALPMTALLFAYYRRFLKNHATHILENNSANIKKPA